MESAGPLPEESTREAADGYKLETGPLAVTEVSDFVLHDEKRNKDLHLRIFYPVQQGKYPVIVFSHGAGGSESCCESLTRHWASYGYITMQPTHDDSIAQRRDTGNDSLRFPQAVRDALKKPALWESRPRDISFLLDSLPELQKRIPGLMEKIDPSASELRAIPWVRTPRKPLPERSLICPAIPHRTSVIRGRKQFCVSRRRGRVSLD